MNDLTHSSAKIFVSSAVTENWVESTSNTNLLVPLQPFILQSGDPAHYILGLESASIPLSIWAINLTNRILKINIHTFTIAEGNYTATGLMSYLNSYSIIGFTNTFYNFSYDSVNNRIRIISTYNVAPYTTTLVIQPETTCQAILGVVVGTHAKTYYAENQLNLTSTSGILIAINNLQTSNRDNQAIASGGTILARIPINCPLYKILTFYNPQPFYTTVANRVISSLNISLLNDDYTPLVLQGNPNYFLTFRIDYADKTPTVIPKTEIQLAREELTNLPVDMSEFKIQDLSDRANMKK